jgi:succinyl-CoA synthetase beta subunit
MNTRLRNYLKRYNVPVQEGIAVDNVMAAEEAYRQIKNDTKKNFAVVKAQIHAGGRGKGKIEGKEQRGVAVGKSLEDVSNIAKKF